MKFKIEPSVDFDSGDIHLKTSTIMDGFANQVSHEVIKTKDEATRSALIALGWTPPPAVNGEWRRVEDGLPTEFIHVLVAKGEWVHAVAYYDYYHESFFDAAHDTKIIGVTSWMELPQPPVVKDSLRTEPVTLEGAKAQVHSFTAEAIRAERKRLAEIEARGDTIRSKSESTPHPFLDSLRTEKEGE